MSTADQAWEVRTLSAPDEAAYAGLVAHSTLSPITHTLAWRNVLTAQQLGEPVYWLAYRDGQLRGALPAFVRRTGDGAILNSLPFIQSTGGVIHAANAAPPERRAVTRVLAEALLSWCRQQGVDIACVIGSAFAPEQEDGWPRAADFTIRRAVRALDLSQPPDYAPSVQGSIKKAERFRPRMREANTVAEACLVHGLYADHMRGLGIEPLGWDFFGCALAEAGGQRWVRFLWAEVGGEPAAGLILMWHGRVVDYYSVGNTALGRTTQAGSWLCDQQIRAARAAGMRWWNWMASPNQNVYDFKKRWGGRDHEYAIQGWILNARAPWRQLSPAALRAEFPGYFVLPYQMMQAA
jgi:hypothetical protein